MELTNEQRKYLGLERIEPHWERVEIPNNCVKPELSTGKDILFFDGDVLRKVIWSHDNGNFRENSYELRTQDNRTMIAPLTKRGKPKRLNGVNISRCTPHGMYFDYNGGILIANYTTQQTYYSSAFAGVPRMEQRELQEFLDQWCADTTNGDLDEIQAFAHAKRRRCKYKEGDFKNNGISYSLNVNKTLVEECIRAGTNEPFWKTDRSNDLRNPIFSKELSVILKQMGA